MPAGFFFPFPDHIKPEAYKMRRACKLFANELYYAIVVFEIVETLPYIFFMQFSPHGVGQIIKLLAIKYSLIACIIYRLNKPGIVDIVCGPPRKIGIVCPGFNNIMLEIIVVNKQ